MSEFSDQTTSRTTTRGTPHRVPPSFEYNPKIRRWLVYHACVCGFQSVHAGELGRGGGDSRRLRCYRALPPGDRCALVGGVSFCFVVNKKGNMDKESLLSRQNEYGPAQGDVSVSEENARVHAAGHPKFPVAAVLSARPLYNTKSLFFEPSLRPRLMDLVHRCQLHCGEEQSHCSLRPGGLMDLSCCALRTCTAATLWRRTGARYEVHYSALVLIFLATVPSAARAEKKKKRHGTRCPANGSRNGQIRLATCCTCGFSSLAMMTYDASFYFAS